MMLPLPGPAAPAAAQQQRHDHGASPGTAAAVENYGQVRFPISCGPQAQERFHHALAMLHSFHFPATGQA